MKRWRVVAATGIALAVLAGCSGETDPQPTGAGTESPSQEEQAPETDSTCDYSEAGDAHVEIGFGEIAAASDEWSEFLGLEWRHYLPITVTNLTGGPCSFSMFVDAEVDGEVAGSTELWIPLLAGQTFEGQVLELDDIVPFSADAEDATPSSPVTPVVASLRMRPMLPDYYDAQFDVQGVSGEGKDAVLTVDIEVTGTREGMPGRVPSATRDLLYVQGLDSAGTVVTSAYTRIDPIPDGQSQTFELPVGGGWSGGGEYYNVTPAAAYDAVTSWQLFLQPELHEDSRM